MLTYHVVQGQMSPQQLIDAGTVPTVQGASVQVAGTPEAMTVNGSTNVICGNMQTANATVYLIDSVLMPQCEPPALVCVALVPCQPMGRSGDRGLAV